MVTATVQSDENKNCGDSNNADQHNDLTSTLKPYPKSSVPLSDINSSKISPERTSAFDGTETSRLSPLFQNFQRNSSIRSSSQKNEAEQSDDCNIEGDEENNGDYTNLLPFPYLTHQEPQQVRLDTTANAVRRDDVDGKQNKNDQVGNSIIGARAGLTRSRFLDSKIAPQSGKGVLQAQNQKMSTLQPSTIPGFNPLLKADWQKTSSETAVMGSPFSIPPMLGAPSLSSDFESTSLFFDAAGIGTATSGSSRCRPLEDMSLSISSSDDGLEESIVFMTPEATSGTGMSTPELWAHANAFDNEAPIFDPNTNDNSTCEDFQGTQRQQQSSPALTDIVAGWKGAFFGTNDSPNPRCCDESSEWSGSRTIPMENRSTARAPLSVDFFHNNPFWKWNYFSSSPFTQDSEEDCDKDADVRDDESKSRKFVFCSGVWWLLIRRATLLAIATIVILPVSVIIKNNGKSKSGPSVARRYIPDSPGEDVPSSSGIQISTPSFSPAKSPGIEINELLHPMSPGPTSPAQKPIVVPVVEDRPGHGVGWGGIKDEDDGNNNVDDDDDDSEDNEDNDDEDTEDNDDEDNEDNDDEDNEDNDDEDNDDEDNDDEDEDNDDDDNEDNNDGDPNNNNTPHGNSPLPPPFLPPSSPTTEPTKELLILDEGAWTGLPVDVSFRWPHKKKGMHLEILSAVDSRWEPFFDATIHDWGQSDAVQLSTAHLDHEDVCAPLAGALKICNGDYGYTDWRGITLVFVEGGEIIASAIWLNDYFFDNEYDGWNQYNICHQIGHALGLSHTLETSCLAIVQDDPEDGFQHPSQINYDVLEATYGNETRRRTTTRYQHYNDYNHAMSLASRWERPQLSHGTRLIQSNEETSAEELLLEQLSQKEGNRLYIHKLYHSP